MRIQSGVTDQYVYFVAVDATDFSTRETGLSSFTVYRSRDGGAAAAMTTPTINETDTTNMPGVYELLLDEDMTIGSGNDNEEMAFHITHAGMAPVTRTIELYRPKITAGNTLDVTTTGAAGIDWGNVENPTTAVDLSATDIQLCDTATTVTNQVTADATAIAGVTAAATNLSKSAIGIEPGAAITGTLSTTQMTTDLTEVTDDHYNRRIIVWTSGVLKNQSTDITAYTGATKLLTYTATTEAPANTDTFVIV